MKISNVFQTEDGKLFNSESEAQDYINSQLSENEKTYRNYLKSFGGIRLLKDHSLDEQGVWRINGEDPNCDFGGYHHNPELETVVGTLESAIRYAITLPRFYTWGSGGSLTKIDIKHV